MIEMNKKYVRPIIFLFLLSIVLVTSCGKINPEIDVKNLDEEDINKLIVCKSPYMRFEAGCCLDTDANVIYEKDEQKIKKNIIPAITIPETTSTIITTTTTIPVSTTISTTTTTALARITTTTTTTIPIPKSSYDLSDYPEPFIDIKNKRFNYIGVVGEDSASITNLALTDIISTLNTVGVEGSAISSFDRAPDAMLDTEVIYPADYNLILVGTTYDNRLIAQFLGKIYPSYRESSGLKEGEAKIVLKSNGDKVALIVTGWEGEDVRRAATVLKDYKAFKGQLEGKEVLVAGTTSSPTIVK